MTSSFSPGGSVSPSMSVTNPALYSRFVSSRREGVSVAMGVPVLFPPLPLRIWNLYEIVNLVPMDQSQGTQLFTPGRRRRILNCKKKRGPEGPRWKEEPGVEAYRSGVGRGRGVGRCAFGLPLESRSEGETLS